MELFNKKIIKESFLDLLFVVAATIGAAAFGSLFFLLFLYL